MKDRITCHILDTAAGRPAAGVRVRLELTAPVASEAHPQATKKFESQTNEDGRVTSWLPYSDSNASGDVPIYTLDDVLDKAEEEVKSTSASTEDKAAEASPLSTTWTLRFDTGSYYGPTAFFPEVAVTFRVNAGQHYHVPLLLSPYSYTTYRGS